MDDGETVVIFQSFPDPEFGKTTTYRYDGDQGTASVFDLSRNDDGRSSLYVAGAKGISQFVDKDDDGTLICSDPGVSQLFVSRQSESISCWYLNAAAELQFLSNEYIEDDGSTTSGKWNDPLTMYTGITDLAPIRGQNISNHLFLIDQDGNPIHGYQSAAEDQLWRSSQLQVSSMDDTQEINTYTLHVTFTTSQTSQSVAGETVRLSASSDVYLVVNEKSCHLGPDTTVEAEITVNSDIHLCNEIDEMAAPTIYIEADFLTDKLEVELPTKATDRVFAQGSTADDLTNATTSDGEPLIDTDKVDSDTIEASAGCLSAVSDTCDSIKKNAAQPFSVATFNERHPQNNANSPYTATHYVFQKRSDGTCQVITGQEAAELMEASNSFLSKIGHAYGAFKHALKTIENEAYTIGITLLKDTAGAELKFIVGDKTYKWIVNTLESALTPIWDAMTWIACEIEKIIEWIGYLLEWEDILATHRYLKSMFNGVLDNAKANPDVLKGALDSFYDDWGTFVGDPSLISSEQSATPSDGLDGIDCSSTNPADPRSSWSASKSGYAKGVSIPSFSSASASSESDNPWAAITDSLETLDTEFFDAIGTLATQFVDAVEGKISFGQMIENFAEGCGGALGEFCKAFTDFIFDNMEEFLSIYSDIINAEIKVPFFSSLYKLITGDNLTLLDVVCLLAAVPMTIGFKLQAGKNIFEGNSAQMISYFSNIFTPSSSESNTNETTVVYTFQQNIGEASFMVFAVNLIRTFFDVIKLFTNSDNSTTDKYLIDFFMWLKATCVLVILNATKSDIDASDGEQGDRLTNPDNDAIQRAQFGCAFYILNAVGRAGWQKYKSRTQTVPESTVGTAEATKKCDPMTVIAKLGDAIVYAIALYNVFSKEPHPDSTIQANLISGGTRSLFSLANLYNSNQILQAFVCAGDLAVAGSSLGTAIKQWEIYKDHKDDV